MPEPDDGLRDLLERRAQAFTPSVDPWERVARRAGRRQRNRRIGATAVALAVFVAALGGLWAAFRPGPQPASFPSVVRVIHLDGFPGGMTAGFGDLWVRVSATELGSTQGTSSPTPGGFIGLERVDPATDRVLARFPLPAGYPSGSSDNLVSPITGFGSVWVTVPGGNSARANLLRIDPRTNRVTATIPMPSDCCGAMVAGAGSVWVSAGERGLVHVDPSTNTVVGIQPASLRGQGAFPITDGARVWSLAFRDSADLAQTSFIPRGYVPPTGSSADAGFLGLLGVPAGFTSQHVLFVAGRFWVGTPGSVDAVTRQSELSLVVSLPGSVNDVAFGGGSLWVAWEPPIRWGRVTPTIRAPSRISRLDPNTGRFVGSPVAVGRPVAGLAFIAGRVWASELHTRELIGIRTPAVPSTTPTTQPPTSTAAAVNLERVNMISPENGWETGSISLKDGASCPFVGTTSDGGRSWANVSPQACVPVTHAFAFSSFFLDSNHGWVLVSSRQRSRSASEAVYMTDDGGLTWNGGQPIAAFGGIFTFSDPQHGWLLQSLGAAAGSEGAEVWRTTDGGMHWIKIAATRGDGFVHAGQLTIGCAEKTGIAFKDAMTGWISEFCGGGDPYIFVTHDGGSTWNQVGLQNNGICEGGCGTSNPQFFGDVGFMAGQYSPRSRLFVTTDGGETWSSLPLPASGWATTDFVDGTHGFLSLTAPKPDSFRYFATSDGGHTWTRFTPNMALDPAALSFVTPTVGFDLVKGQLLTTTDGGLTWTVVG